MSTSLDKVFEKLRSDLTDIELKDVKRSEFAHTIESPAFTVGEGDFALTAQANSDLDLLVLNDSSDVDSDAVFAQKIVGPDGETIAPYISFDSQRAWLKYKITGTLTAKESPGKGLLSTVISAPKSWSIADYRKHDATQKVFSALDADRQNLRSIFNVAQVKALQPGEALSLQTDGSLSVNATLSWSDALSTSMSELTDLVSDGVPVAVSLSAGASVDVKLSVEDDFMVVISRAADSGKLRIAVTKAKSRSAGVKVSLSAEAAVEISSESEVVDKVLEAILGTSASKVEKLVEKLDGTALDVVESDLVKFLQSRLKLGDDADRIKALKKKLETLKEEVVAKLKKILDHKATAGFTYEYQRIDSNSAIADYLLDSDDLLDADHRPAVTGDFATITQRLNEGGGREVVRYLNQRTMSRSSAFGFTLGFGSWTLSFQDKTTLDTVERKNMKGDGLMISVKGARSYTEPRLENNDFTWVVDLKADMDHYSAAPVTTEFDYGLSYLATFKRKALDANDVSRFADFAQMWRVVPGSGATTVRDALTAAVGKETQVDFQLIFSNDDDKPTEGTLIRTLDGIPKFDRTGWANALASAMPWSTAPSRSQLATRAAAYAPFWATWLATDGPLDPNAMRAELSRRIDGAAADLALDRSPMSFLFYVRPDTRVGMRKDLANFIEGLDLLSELIAFPRNWQELRRAWSLLQPWWRQRLYIAASGAYLLGRAANAGVLAKVQRTMTVTAGGNATTVSS